MPTCTHAILDSDNVIINRHAVDHDTFPNGWSPGPGLTHHPICENPDNPWAQGGTIINGIYTPPPEPDEPEDAPES